MENIIMSPPRFAARNNTNTIIRDIDTSIRDIYRTMRATLTYSTMLLLCHRLVVLECAMHGIILGPRSGRRSRGRSSGSSSDGMAAEGTLGSRTALVELVLSVVLVIVLDRLRL